MKKHMLALLLSLTIFLSVGVEAFALQTSHYISSQGVISSSPPPTAYWGKTVTWGDGAKETIEITEKGQIFINSVAVKGTSFSWFGFCSPAMTDEQIQNILFWMISKGVRFADIYFYTHNTDFSKTTLDKYMPKFYDNKIFVVMILTNYDAYWEDYTLFESGYNTLVDYIDTKGYYKNIVAWEIAHEDDHWAIKKGRTLSWFSTHLDTLKAKATAKLSTKSWGNLPLIIAENGISRDWEYDKPYHEAVAQKTDILYNDFYSVQSKENIDKFLTWHRQRYKSVGKDGYKVWYETGYSVPTDNDNYTPELYFYLRNQTDTGLISLWHVWREWQESLEWETHQEWWFKPSSGTIIVEPWTENLAPYFAK